MLNTARNLSEYNVKRLAAIFVLAVLLVSAFGALLLPEKQALAAANSTINFQARLMNASGSIAPDGDYNIEFKIYNALTPDGGETPLQGACTTNPGAATDEDCLWVETRTSGNKIHVANGYLTASLGSVTAFASTINWEQDLWITMRVGGTGTPSWDTEMSPRLKLTAVPYAFRAGQLSRLNGSFAGTLTFASSYGQDSTITLPDPGASTATVCYQNSTSCGFVSGSATNFIQNGTTVQTAANFNIRSTATNAVTGVLQGANGQTADLFDVQSWNGTAATTVFGVNNVGDLTVQNINVAANKSITLASGTGTYSQTYSNNTGVAATFAVTDGASTGTTSVQGVAINLTGTNNGSGSNSISGLTFGNVAAATNNAFHGIDFGTGYTDLLRYNGTALISGTGIVQSAAISGSYTGITGVGTLTVGALGAGFTTVGVAQGGTGATTLAANGVLYGNGTGAIQATGVGTTGQCLLGNTGTAPTWGTCATGTVTLQTAYANGSTISTTGTSLGFTLNNSDNFTVTTAASGTGGTTFALADGSNATPASQLVLITNNDTDQILANGLTVSAAAGGITDGLDVSDGDLVNAINVGDNIILGTTATIDFTNFDVSSAGAVTAVGVNSGTGLIQGTGGLTISGATLLTGATTGDAFTLSNSSSTGNIAVLKDNNTTVLTVADGGAVTLTNSVDSTNALTVTNSAGGNVLVVNSSGSGNTLSVGRPGSPAYVATAVTGTYAGGAVTNQSFTFSRSVPAGHSLVGTLMLSATNVPPAVQFTSIQDSAGNSYTVDASTTNSSNVAIYVFSGNVVSPITAGQTLNFIIPLPGSTGRWALDVEEFGNLVWPSAADKTATNSGSSTSLSTGTTATTAQSNELVFGGFAYAAGRVFTPGAGFTASTQQATSGGSNDRAVSGAWKYALSTGTQAATATLDSSSGYAAAIVTYKSGNPNLGGLAGSLQLYDGNSSFYGTLAPYPAGLTANRSYTLPNESGTICIQSSTNCGFAPSTGSTVYATRQLDNLSSVAINAALGFLSSQTANINFNGSAASANALNITGQTSTGGNGGDILIQGGTSATSSQGGTTTIRGGNTGTTGTNGTLTLDAGSGATAANGTINIGAANASTISLGNSTVGKTINIGAVGSTAGASSVFIASTSSSSSTQAVTIGSNGATGNTIDIDSGTGVSAIEIGNTSTAHGIQIGSNATGDNDILLGGANAGSTVTIEGGTNASAIQIGNGATAHGIKIGTGAAVQTVVVGSTNSSSSTSIQGGSNGVAINATAGNLALSTTTSGTLSLTSAGALNFTGAAASTWTLGSNTLGVTSSNFNVSTGGVLNVVGGSAGFQIGGAAASGNYLRGNGTSFVSSAIQSGDIPACTGTCNYISNQTTQQTSANFNILSVAAGSIGGLIQGAASQTAANLVLKGGSTPGANADLLQLQTSSSTVARFDNAGNLFTPSIDAQTAGTLTVGSTNATTINVGTNNAAHTIGIGNAGATGTQAITIGGNGNTANTIDIDAGTGASSIEIGNTATAHGIQIGTGAAVQTVSIGSTNSTSTMSIQGGNTATGNGAISIQAAASGLITIGTTNNNPITLGGTSGTTTLQGTVKLSTLGATTSTAVAVCRDSSTTNFIACDTASGAPFIQGGNTFSATGVLGTNDSQALQFETNNTGRALFDTSNNLYLGNASSAGTAASPSSFTIRGTGSATSGTAGGSLTVIGGTGNGTALGIGGAVTIQGGTGGTASTGGQVTVQGGNAGAGSGLNGANVTITGGTGDGSGVLGLVRLAPTTFLSSGSTQTFNGGSGCPSCSVTGVDSYGSIAINASVASLSINIPVPNASNQIVGRLLYVTAVSGSNDFTIVLGGTSISIAMKANSTATLIWNGAGWTAAGASSSTDLQSAYNNTLTSAGGAELLLNAPGGNADGLTIRNNGTTPVVGGLLEVQNSIGSNLFSVNNNATEYASNGGAESTFSTSNWQAASTGGTVTRITTPASAIATGQASVSVVTTTTNHGALNKLSGSLTTGLQYTVSYAVKSSSASFSTLNTYYSVDGTTASTICATGSTVASAIWTRVICTFTAPGSITSNNGIIIRQSDGTGRTFYLDNLSITVNAGVNHAVDGSVESAPGTNWVAIGGSVARVTSPVYDTSGALQVTTSGTAGRGAYNNLTAGIIPQVSTQYRVSFYARGDSTNTATLAVAYTPDNNSTSVSCTDYSTQVALASAYTAITCYFTTSATTPVTSQQLRITQTAGSATSFYIDGLTVTLNTNTANNVQIGGANKGGPPTLFTLDRSSTAPIAANNDAYLGSMYYDTTSGRIQCYEADGWGACGAAPDNIVNLNPEYAGAVLNGSGIGTMTADFCANQSGVLQVNYSTSTDPCFTSGDVKNYYKWTSPQATQQTYSIYVTYQLPATFNGFSSDDTVQLTGRVSDTTNAAVTYQMYYKTAAGSLTQCWDSTTSETTVATSNNTWQSVGVNGNEATGCSLSSSAANGFIIFKINLKAKSNASAFVSTLSFVTTGR
jgi:hypothetical protein